MKIQSTLLKTLIIGSLFVGIAVVLLPYSIVALTPAFCVDLGSVRFIGLLPLALGACLDLWCIRDFVVRGKGTPAPFDPPTQLVIKGSYRYMRNPMYTGLFFMLAGEALLYASLPVLLYALLVIAADHIFVVVFEEPKLKQEFGEAYEEYLRTVPRWLPKIPKS